jgi:hypothetical protein
VILGLGYRVISDWIWSNNVEAQTEAGGQGPDANKRKA